MQELPNVNPHTNALSGWLVRKTGALGLWKRRFFNYDPARCIISYFGDEVTAVFFRSWLGQ
jgi:hypothetical protein